MKKVFNTHPSFKLINGKSPKELFGDLPTPCYVIDEEKLIENGKILAGVSERTGVKILLAQKAFSNYDFYPLLSEYIAGTEASGLYETRLGKEEMPEKENHVFCAAYSEKEFDEILKYADHIVFNSPGQLKKFGTKAKECGKSIGLRINPEFSTQEEHEIYNPCAAGSRLGTTRGAWDSEMTTREIEMLDGLHFHTLCEQNSDDLETTLYAVEEKFGDILPDMKWLNMGGGHLITKEDYDIPTLEKCINYAREKWNLDVYLEPGEAVAYSAGFMVTRVLDVVNNGNYKIGILDVSAACHMPDVIEMPYTPPCFSSVEPEKDTVKYRLAGPTCLSGDIIGDYTFKENLQYGDIIVFGDMAIYTTCKNNTFNGMALPDIWKKSVDGKLERLTNFGYEDFKQRLGKRKSS